MTNHGKLPHRFNRDGTIDSICPRCFVTVATSTSEAALEFMEAAHACEPELLRHYEEELEQAQKRMPQMEGAQRFPTAQRAG